MANARNPNGFNFNNLALAGGGAALGGGIANLFSDYENPADSARPYFNQMPDILKKYLSPYIEAGQRALPGMESAYGELMSSPGGVLNRIGSNYQQSPGFQFSLKQALDAANRTAAAGGMIGSPMNQQNNMDIATNLANRDYNNWIQNALGLYGKGLSGNESLYGIGAQTGIGLGEDLASILANRAKLEYEAQQAENQREGGTYGAIGAGIGELLPLLAFGA